MAHPPVPGVRGSSMTSESGLARLEAAAPTVSSASTSAASAALAPSTRSSFPPARTSPYLKTTMAKPRKPTTANEVYLPTPPVAPAGHAPGDDKERRVSVTTMRKPTPVLSRSLEDLLEVETTSLHSSSHSPSSPNGTIRRMSIDTLAEAAPSPSRPQFLLTPDRLLPFSATAAATTIVPAPAASPIPTIVVMDTPRPASTASEAKSLALRLPKSSYVRASTPSSSSAAAAAAPRPPPSSPSLPASASSLSGKNAASSSPGKSPKGSSSGFFGSLRSKDKSRAAASPGGGASSPGGTSSRPSTLNQTGASSNTLYSIASTSSALSTTRHDHSALSLPDEFEGDQSDLAPLPLRKDSAFAPYVPRRPSAASSTGCSSDLCGIEPTSWDLSHELNAVERSQRRKKGLGERDSLRIKGLARESKAEKKARLKREEEAFNPDARPTAVEMFEASLYPIIDGDGKTHMFGDLIKDQRTIVAFIRHWYCPLCQDFMYSIVRDVDPEALERAGAKLIIIGNGNPKVIHSYQGKVFKCPFPVYSDPSLELYRALGMTRQTMDAGAEEEKGDYIIHSAIGGTVSVAKNLGKMGRKGLTLSPGHFTQLGGEFVLGPGLAAHYAHRMSTTRGHASIKIAMAHAGVIANRRPRPPGMEKPPAVPIKDAGELDRISWKVARDSELERMRAWREERRKGRMLYNPEGETILEADSEDGHTGSAPAVDQRPTSVVQPEINEEEEQEGEEHPSNLSRAPSLCPINGKPLPRMNSYYRQSQIDPLDDAPISPGTSAPQSVVMASSATFGFPTPPHNQGPNDFRFVSPTHSRSSSMSPLEDLLDPNSLNSLPTTPTGGAGAPLRGFAFGGAMHARTPSSISHRSLTAALAQEKEQQPHPADKTPPSDSSSFTHRTSDSHDDEDDEDVGSEDSSWDAAGADDVAAAAAAGEKKRLATAPGENMMEEFGALRVAVQVAAAQ